ncbi:hypothetical protein [Sphingobacterium sp. LRF_L2]|uniref:hypothetical protein n=1 Tax=Sphingobacterium sp. LRF_L2 TaxID=3369421 RepID=UPI003F5E577C
MLQQKLLTDNATLSDAAIGFYALENNYAISQSILPNWLKFIENSVLYDKMVVDNNVFVGNNWAQKLLNDFNNVEGIDLDSDTRKKINQNADKKISELDNLEFSDIRNNQVRSNIKRLLFYLGVSNEISSTYSPSAFRNELFKSLSGIEGVENEDNRVVLRLLENVVKSANKYVENVEKESGIKMALAQLPPIASFVLDTATKCGSWTEAISLIREKRILQHFREWSAEITDALLRGDTKAIDRLAKLNNFIRGWGDNEKGIAIGGKISLAFQVFGISFESSSLNFSVPNPFVKKHVVFLNDTFHSLLAAEKNWGNMKQIKI